MITANIQNLQVHIGGVRLDPDHSQKLVNHSPDGFAWGYSGSGPAQLALAILLHFTKNDKWSVANYQEFKFDVVARWSQGANMNIPNKVATDWIKKHGGVVR